MIPAGQIDPFAKKIQALIPLPNTGGPNAVFNNYAVPIYGVPTVQTIPSVKIDQNLSSLMKLSGYWSTNRIDSPGGDGLLDPISTRTVSQDRTHTIRLNFDYTMKPTLLLHIGAGMVHANSFLGAPTLGDASLVVPNVNNKNYLSYFSALNAGARGGYIGIGANAATTALGPQQLRRFKNEKPSANMSLTWVRNNHTYKAGGEVIVDGYVSAVEAYSNGNFAFSTNETSQPYLQSVSAPFTPGHNYASFLLGAVDSGSTAGVANSRLGNHSLGFFLEDTYKVNRKLTLDYGIRYDFTMYLREQYGRIPAWSPTVLNPKIVSPSGSLLPGGVAYEGNGIAGHCNCDLAKNYPYGLGPRLGVAYQINSKTVFRGGAGVNYGKAPEFGWLGGSINGLINFATSNPYSPKFYLKDGLNVPAVFPSVDPGAFPVSAAGRETPTYVIDPNAGRPARIFTWSIGLQREVSHDIVVEAAYVGNRGAWEQGNISQVNALTAQRAASFGFDIHNAADLTVLAKPIGQALTDPRVKLPYVGFPLTGPVYSALRPFPQFNTNLQMLWSPTGKSWYDSLQAKVSKRFSHGLNLQSAFTWQKELQISAENSYALFGFANGAGTFQNDVTAYDQNKYLSIQSRPFQFVTSASYVTPRWKVNKFVGLVTGDWNLATVLRYQSGAIIQLPSTNNNYNNQIGRGGTLAQRVAGVPVFLQDPNCRCFDPTTTLIVNPAAFQQTPAGQFSNSTPYYNDLRATRFPAESMNFGRNFRLGGADSRMGLSVRAEFTNIFNRRVIPAPLLSTSAGLTSPTNYVNGQLTSGFGFINTSGGVSQTPRAGTLVARFTF